MDGHRPKELLDQVRAYPELGEGTPSASNTIPIARSRPTSAGSNAAPLSAACISRPKPTLPRPRSASPGFSPQPLRPVAPSAPSNVHRFAHCVHHFEKMLYDNSQLVQVYLHTWQVTGNDFFRTITEEILDYVKREMTYGGAGANDQQLRPGPQLPSNANGVAGFYSTQDADSEGKEGKFFVWTPDEIREVLGSDPDEFMAAY